VTQKTEIYETPTGEKYLIVSRPIAGGWFDVTAWAPSGLPVFSSMSASARDSLRGIKIDLDRKGRGEGRL